MKGSFYYYIAILRSIARIYSQHLHYSNRLAHLEVSLWSSRLNSKLFRLYEIKSLNLGKSNLCNQI